jgi:hypothetical protein
MSKQSLLSTRMLIAAHTARGLLEQIKKIEENIQTSTMEKFSQIKKIREEIVKVGVEVDNIKREFTILSTHNVN